MHIIQETLWKIVHHQRSPATCPKHVKPQPFSPPKPVTTTVEVRCGDIYETPTFAAYPRERRDGERALTTELQWGGSGPNISAAWQLSLAAANNVSSI